LKQIFVEVFEHLLSKFFWDFANHFASIIIRFFQGLQSGFVSMRFFEPFLSSGWIPSQQVFSQQVV